MGVDSTICNAVNHIAAICYHTTLHLPQAPALAASSNPTQVPDWFSDNNFDVDHH